jgi:2,4-dienoyl-CoA reductase-like NADH-dependent reductase (Old Yellow Enzyme family)/thioredoxin reductase
MKYPHLFSPIQIAGQLFRNRIFGAPTGFVDQDKDGMLPPEAALYYGRKAMGGAASVTIGGCAVDSELGLGQGYTIRLDNCFSGAPYSFHGLTRVAETVNRYGAVCCGELQHAGMYGNRWLNPPGNAYGPANLTDTDGRTVHEMPEEIIERTIRKYADGAAFLKKCGFGMVMVHAGHGWLLHQFLSPRLNTRKDKWGGPDIENRARLTVAVLDAIRKAVGPAFPIEVRITGSECYEGGYDIEEGIAIAKQLDGHADLIHVSVGSHEVEKVFTVTHPSMFLEDGCNVGFAAEIKKHVKVPVAAVGALTDPAMMEEIIASGKADIVELARGLLADPDLPLKARTGDENDINKCMRCLACFSNLMSTGRFRCAINPALGWEAEMRLEVPPAKKKRVLVAGGGIAGMQAAITCAELGHEVILCEKSETLGGALKCEEKVPFKQLLSEYLQRQAAAVDKAGVEVRLTTAATPALAKALAPDVIVSAMGAVPVVPKIDGIDGKNVLSAEYAYVHPDKVGNKAVILGGGLVGMELAVYLSMLGKKITLVEMLDHVNDGGNFQHMKGLQEELDKYAVDVELSTRATAIDSGGVRCENSGTQTYFDADTVIYAVGQRALREDAYALSDCAPEFYPVGDCVAPKNIMNAPAWRTRFQEYRTFMK